MASRAELYCYFCGHGCGEVLIPGALRRPSPEQLNAAYATAPEDAAPVWDRGHPPCPPPRRGRRPPALPPLRRPALPRALRARGRPPRRAPAEARELADPRQAELARARAHRRDHVADERVELDAEVARPLEHRGAVHGARERLVLHLLADRSRVHVG